MKVLLFDFDGVVVDSFSIVYKISKSVLSKYGVNIKNKNDFLKLYKRNWYESVKEFGVSESEIKKIVNHIADKLSQAYSKVKPFENMKAVLKKLSANNKVIIITSSPGKCVEEYLRKNGFPKLKVIGAEKETSKVKKIKLMEKKFPDDDICYIGDTAGDIKEGKTAKVKTVAVTWGYHKKKTLVSENPDFVVDSPKELFKLFC